MLTCVILLKPSSSVDASVSPSVSGMPSIAPSDIPSLLPSLSPSEMPSSQPSANPSSNPSSTVSGLLHHLMSHPCCPVWVLLKGHHLSQVSPNHQLSCHLNLLWIQAQAHRLATFIILIGSETIHVRTMDKSLLIWPQIRCFGYTTH